MGPVAVRRVADDSALGADRGEGADGMRVGKADAGAGGKLAPEELRTYWCNLSERFVARDREGLALICVAGMPRWFNGFVDRYQRMAFARLTRGVDFRGARVLDLGSGIGRWAHWFVRRGAARVVGIDLERERLRLARARRGDRPIDYQEMMVDALAFASGAFDVVNCVTVLQHVDHDVKLRALAEVARVLRPGGYVTLFELIDESDDAGHVFPERRQAWIDMCRAERLHLLRTVGDQYTPLLRLGKAAFTRIAGRRGRRWIDQFKAAGPDQSVWRPSPLALRALVLLSYPLEELCQRTLPPSAAKIGGFLLRKGTAQSMSPEDEQVST